MDSFKIINISSKAEQYFVNLLKDKAPETRVRVFVANPGTPGVECGILYCPKDMITGADDIFEYNGFDIVIDRTSQPYLKNSKIDVEEENGSETLTFKAPELKKLDIPEDATLDEKIRSFFQTTVNPSLAAHGGKANVISVSEDGIIRVEFLGGCKGCSMVNVTLKEGIEANLKQAFPGMIKEVVDNTNHEQTEETYKPA